jgi:type 1 glutamine amidotransferase
MGLLRYDTKLRALLLTKGHPFQRDAFAAVFDGMHDVSVSAVEHPAAEAFFAHELAREYDAVVCYDMPGIEFRAGAPPRFVEPSEAYVRGFLRLLDSGLGFVFLHHALAGWPAWPEYAEILGGRFLYQPAELRGRMRPDSGYRHGVTHRVRVAARGHPVVAGLGEGFEITDELYLAEVFEEDVEPLLRSDHAFVASGFYSAAQAIAGRMFSNQGWTHPAGSNLIAWAKHYRASPIVYVACGDDATAYANPGFRTLVENSIRWVASPAARDWVRARSG